MLPLRKGRYVARLAATPQEVRRAQQLRWLAFVVARTGDDAARQADGGGSDADAFDPLCQHLLVEEASSGALVCCCRLLALPNGAAIGQSYAAQYYDLSALHAFGGSMLEVGRFCIHPDRHDHDILRLAWGALARIVDTQNVAMLFGCSSFAGTDPGAYAAAFDVLQARHLAPERWMPGIKAPMVIRFGTQSAAPRPDLRTAMLVMPPLLRSYLTMGGWVSDHAVVDRDLGTLHVFTGLEITAIPPSRARALRAIAGTQGELADA